MSATTTTQVPEQVLAVHATAASFLAERHAYPLDCGQYHAAWITPEGDIWAVPSHCSIGGYGRNFTEGRIRLAAFPSTARRVMLDLEWGQEHRPTLAQQKAILALHRGMESEAGAPVTGYAKNGGFTDAMALAKVLVTG